MKYRLLKIVVPLLFSVLLAQEQSIAFQQIENLIIERNHELKALEKSIESFKGNLHQNSLRPNPELEFESGRGSDAETATQLNQTIELGKKRQKRTRVAELELESAKIAFLNKKLAILKDARLVFIDILLAQQVISLKKETVAITNDFFQSVQKRVVAGSLSPAEEARAQISLTTQIVDLNRAQRNMKNNWRVLSSFWGTKSLDFTIAKGKLNSMIQIPPEEVIRLAILDSPSLLEKDIEIQIQQAVIEAERANRIPNITFFAGAKKTDAAFDTYQAGLSIPLQVFDRNQGTIQSSNALLEQLLEEKEALQIDLETQVASIHSELITINQEIDALKSTILPAAEKAYKIINDGYKQGKFDFLDVIDAQTTLYEVEENYWLAITDFNLVVAEIDMLLGQPLTSFFKSN